MDPYYTGNYQGLVFRNINFSTDFFPTTLCIAFYIL